jgi:hypothetical protein
MGFEIFGTSDLEQEVVVRGSLYADGVSFLPLLNPPPKGRTLHGTDGGA